MIRIVRFGCLVSSLWLSGCMVIIIEGPEAQNHTLLPSMSLHIPTPEPEVITTLVEVPGETIITEITCRPPTLATASPLPRIPSDVVSNSVIETEDIMVEYINKLWDHIDLREEQIQQFYQTTIEECG